VVRGRNELAGGGPSIIALLARHRAAAGANRHRLRHLRPAL